MIENTFNNNFIAGKKRYAEISGGSLRNAAYPLFICGKKSFLPTNKKTFMRNSFNRIFMNVLLNNSIKTPDQPEYLYYYLFHGKDKDRNSFSFLRSEYLAC